MLLQKEIQRDFFRIGKHIISTALHLVFNFFVDNLLNLKLILDLPQNTHFSDTTDPHLQKIAKKYIWHSGSPALFLPGLLNRLDARTISLISSEVLLDYMIREQGPDSIGNNY